MPDRSLVPAVFGLLLSAVLAAPAAAAPTAETTAATTTAATTTAADLPAQAHQTWQAMMAVQRLTARFEQVRHSSLLATPLISTGQLAFQRPDRLRWTVRTPAPSDFVMQGSKVGMLWPDLGLREELDLAATPEAAQIVHAMMTWLGGDLDQLLADYAVEWVGGTPAVVRLTPRGGGLSAVLEQVELEVAGSPPVVRRIRMTEPGGDRVEIRFEDLQLDPALPPETFQLPALPAR